MNPSVAVASDLSEHSNHRPQRVIPHTRPLYFHGGKLFCSRFHRIFSTVDGGRTFALEAELAIPTAQRIFQFSSLAQRVLRLSVYRMRVLPCGNRVFVFRRGIYTQVAGDPSARLTFPVTRGSRPVSLADDGEGRIVFGEYFSNPDRGAVHVYASDDGGQTWEVAYTFPAGAIRHVHGISHDPWRGGFWICTGDYDEENQLLWSDSDFSQVEVVRQGGQQNRFYYLQVNKDYLITATDTPLEDNHVMLIEKSSGRAAQVARIENSNFYGCQVGDRVFLSTNAEPSPVNDVSASHLWMGDLETEQWKRVLSFPVDWYDRLTHLPGVKKGLFQYPRVFFPEGPNPTNWLVCYCLGVERYQDAMVCFDADQFSCDPAVRRAA